MPERLAMRSHEMQTNEGTRAATAPGTHVLMCPPAYYDVAYAINPWMNNQIGCVRHARAEAQWTVLRKCIERFADVDIVEPVRGLPDMTFTANAGVAFAGIFVPSRFRHRERNGEEAHFARWFEEHGFSIRMLPPDLVFEGAGDALFDATYTRLWVGSGQRSDPRSAGWLADTFAIDCVPLNLIEERFYHLDTCFCALPDGGILYYPAAFDKASLARIDACVDARDRVTVSQAEAETFACNALCIGRTLIASNVGARLRAILRGRGIDAVEAPLGEFLKSGGSAKCLAFPFEAIPAAAEQDAAA